jgi:phage FluMu gp28-like protein
MVGRDSVEPSNGPAQSSHGSTESRPTDGPIWKCHFVDIYRAQRDGLPVNIEELKAGMADAEGWAQEFECQFLDAQAVLLPYDLIAARESPEDTAIVPPEFWQATSSFPLVMGIDFGRRRDLTVAWTLKRSGDVLQTVEVLEMLPSPG